MTAKTPREKQPLITFWLAKYVCSTGEVTKLQGRRHEEGDAYVWVEQTSYSSTLYKIGRDVFLTEDEAVNEARRLIARKIKSVSKQLAKLQALAAKI